MSPKTLNITEAAQYLGVPKRTLYLMLSDGRFTVEPVAGIRPRRWNVEDLDRWRGIDPAASLAVAG